MLKDITLGQFFPGKSILHKLDARFKILLMLAFVVLVFFADNLISFGYLLCLVVFMAVVSHISIKVLLQGLKPIVVISVFTALINLFWTTGTNTVFEFGFIHIYSEGIWRAVYMMIRIVSLVMGTSILLTYCSAEKDQAAGARVFDDDEPSSSFCSYFDRGNGKDYQCSKSQRSRF